MARPRMFRWACVAASVLLWGGLGATAGWATPRGKVVIAVDYVIPSVDPNGQIGDFSRGFLDAVFEKLVDYDEEKHQPAPRLATSWEVQDGGARTLFRLRRGVKFHNGDPFTARDVKYSFERTRENPGSTGADYMLYFVREVEVIDDYTVVFHLNHRNPSFAQGQEFWIVPQKYTEAIGSKNFSRHPVGTGPFKFVARQVAQFIKLEANEAYWGGAPPVKELELRMVPEAATRVATVLTGEADIALAVPPFMEDRIKSSPDIRTVLNPLYMQFSILFGLTLGPKTPFHDLRVRQAVEHAIDKDAIAKRVMSGRATPIATVPPYALGYDASIPANIYNPSRARQLLAEAGYPNGFTTELIVYRAGALSIETMEAVAQYLGEVGIQVKLVPMEIQSWIGRGRTPSGYSPMTMYRLPQVSAFATNSMMTFISNKAVVGKNHNFPRLNELIDTSWAIPDPRVLETRWRDIHREVYDQKYWIKIYSPVFVNAVRTRITYTPRRGSAFSENFARIEWAP